MKLIRLVVVSTLALMVSGTSAWAAEESSNYKIDGSAGEQILTDSNSLLGWQKDHKRG